ncbi:stage 0 sporulation family protein, partial [Treponema pallidum]
KLSPNADPCTACASTPAFPPQPMEEEGEFLYQLRLEYSREVLYARFHAALRVHTFVVVPTRYGNDIARCVGRIRTPVQTDIASVVRVASDQDLCTWHIHREKERAAEMIFRDRIEHYQLEMKCICCHYPLEEARVVFLYSAPARVDFRELVRDLGATFGTRVELRQINEREEARIVGGIDCCGRALCCCSVFSRLRPVSVKMVKEKNLLFRSTQMMGRCGRLRCCLTFEE